MTIRESISPESRELLGALDRAIMRAAWAGILENSEVSINRKIGISVAVCILALLRDLNAEENDVPIDDTLQRLIDFCNYYADTIAKSN